MNSCDEYAIKTLRYLDEDLEEYELEDYLSHLDSCARCREQLEAEKNSPQPCVDHVLCIRPPLRSATGWRQLLSPIAHRVGFKIRSISVRLDSWESDCRA